MIKRQRKVSVSQPARDAYKRACELQLRAIRDRLASMYRDSQKRFLDRERFNIGRLRSIIRDDGPGAGMDLAVTRLRAVDLATIDVAEVGGVEWFVGRTWAPFEIEVVRYSYGSRRRGQYDNDERAVSPDGYEIWFPVKALGQSNISKVAFLPLVDPSLTARHMHQYAIPLSDGNVRGVPVLADSHTCWSEFGSPIASAMLAVDLPGLFQLLLKFAGRFYPGSPLIHLDQLQSVGVIK